MDNAYQIMQNAMIEFKTGAYLVSSLIWNSYFTNSIFSIKRFRSILLSFSITILVFYVIAVPFQIILFLLQSTFSLFDTQTAIVLNDIQSSFSLWNIALITVWYLPLLVLFFKRVFSFLGSNSSAFEKELKKLDLKFAKRLKNAPMKQNFCSTIMRLGTKLMQMLGLGLVIILMKIIPQTRYLVSIAIITYEVYRKVMKVRKHLGNVQWSLIVVAITIVCSGNLGTIMIYFGEFYLTSIALSREMLSLYFCKVSYAMEKEDYFYHKWILFGFGTVLVICLSIPVLGLLLYPTFEMAAAHVLINMRNTRALSFDRSVVK